MRTVFLLGHIFLVLALGVASASSVRAQDDDDVPSAFVPPAWASEAVQKAAEGDHDDALRVLDKLEAAHRGSYVIPFLRAKVWGEKYINAFEDNEKIAVLRQERRYLFQAKALAKGNAAILAEIESDLLHAESLIRDAGGTVEAAPATPAKAAPAPVIKRPAASPIIRYRPSANRSTTNRNAARPVVHRATPSLKVKKLPPMARRRGYVVGRAIFPDGRPIPSFDVSVLGYDGQINLFAGSTPSLGWGKGHNGRYAIRTMDTFRHEKPVNGLVTAIQLKTKINYRGKVYTMSLCPIDNLPDGGGKGEFKAYSGPGIVRDFVLKISGVKPHFKIYNQAENDAPNEQSTFYGGQITLLLDSVEGTTPRLMDAPRGSKIVLTLVPQGPLLDGSRGQTITRYATIGPAAYYAYLRNIPIGAYSITATLTTPGGEVWNLRGNTASKDYTSTMNVVFQPSFSDLVGGADVLQLYLVR